MFVKKQLKQLKMYKPGKSAEEANVVKLSSNENRYGTSPKVAEALGDFQNFAEYPDGSGLKLKEGLAQHLKYGLTAENIILGAGADEVIQMLSRGLLSPGDHVVIPDPSFSQYEHHAIIEGVEITKVPLIDGVHDLEGMLTAITEKTKIIWICNPNNPTGTYVTGKALEAFLKQVPSHILVAVDEAYVEYVVADDFPNTLALLEAYENLFILRTFSKIYGLASFRIGYGIGAASLVGDLEVSRLPFNTSSVAQLAARVALEDEAFVVMCKEKNRVGLEQLEAFFEERGVEFYPSQGNFIFIPTERAFGIAEMLEKAGYIVRAFPVGVRITVGTEADNLGLLGALGRVNCS